MKPNAPPPIPSPPTSALTGFGSDKAPRRPRLKAWHWMAVVATAIVVLVGGCAASLWLTSAALRYDQNPPPPKGTPSAATWQVGSTVRQVEFHPSGKTLAVLQVDGPLTLRSIPDGRVLSTLEISKSLQMLPLIVPPTRAPEVVAATATALPTDEVGLLAPTVDESQLGKPFDAAWGAMAFSADGTLLAASSQQFVRTCLDWLSYANDPRACPRHITGTWRVMAAIWRVDAGTGNLVSITPAQVLTSTSFLGRNETTDSEPMPAIFRFSPDNHALAMGNIDGSVTLWDVASGRLVKTLPGTPSWVGLLYDIKAIAWSDDSSTLYTGDYDEVAREWDVATGKLKRESSHSDEHSRGHSTYVMSYQFSPDGQLEATASWAYEIALFRRANGDLVKTIGTGDGPRHLSDIMSLAFSPDSKLIASGGSMKRCMDTSGCGSDDPTVRVWRVSDGTQLALYSGHTSTVGALSWSPNGRIVASGSDDGTVRLWDVSAVH